MDRKLVALGLAETRSRAQALIKAGAVLCDGARVTRASTAAPEGAELSLDAARAAEALPFVSRGGQKLDRAFDAFDLSATGAVAIDLGASTGGFTEVLLARGAARVYAVDIGAGQLAPALAEDPRVIRREGVNARSLSRQEIPEAPDLLAADLSFISLLKALPAPLTLLADRAALILLVKPQFEVGRALVGRGGLVRDASAQEAAVARIETFLSGAGWRALGAIESPIRGGDGNREFLLAAARP